METGGRHLRALPLPQHNTSLSKREFLHIAGVLIFAAAAQGTSLIHLALEAGGACVLGPLEQLTIRSWQATATSLSVKEVYLLVLELQTEGQASGLARTWDLQISFQGTELVDTIFTVFLCLITACQ